MADAFGHDETLPRGNIDNAIFKVDQELSVENKKEFIDVSVFVPVIFALNHRHPDDRIVHLHSVWLCHLSVQASASFCTSINSSGPCRMLR